MDSTKQEQLDSQSWGEYTPVKVCWTLRMRTQWSPVCGVKGFPKVKDGVNTLLKVEYMDYLVEYIDT